MAKVVATTGIAAWAQQLTAYTTGPEHAMGYLELSMISRRIFLVLLELQKLSILQHVVGEEKQRFWLG